MPNLLVTGGAGFIGSSFVRQAIAEGHTVTVLDALTYAGHTENLAGLSERFEFVKGNIADAELVASLLKNRRIQAVAHLAAESHVDRSITGPADFVQTNVTGTFVLLNEALKYWDHLPKEEQSAFRFIQVSTDEVYGSLGSTGKFSETTPYSPNSPYSASKASGDFLARAWFHTYGLPTVITNCSNNYGPRQYPEKLIPLMISRALSQGKLPVYGNGSNVRDWIHVEDHCNGVLLALKRGEPGSTYCFGGNAEFSNIDLVKTLCACLDRLQPRKDGQKHESSIEFVKDRPGHDFRYAIDDTKAQKELGFKRKYKFESGLEATVKWYVENLAWCRAVEKKR
ncbi:dTDP-glucose 4,6-dehydratase [bacterium]|nr:dTDP-glucose 4,6-dehydratase [bacterium]